ATQPLNPRYRRPGRVRPARLWRRGRARRRGEAFEPFCAALFERRDLPAALATHSGTRAAALYQVAAEGGVGFQLQPRRRGAGLFIEPLALLEPSLLGVVGVVALGFAPLVVAADHLPGAIASGQVAIVQQVFPPSVERGEAFGLLARERVGA